MISFPRAEREAEPGKPISELEGLEELEGQPGKRGSVEAGQRGTGEAGKRAEARKRGFRKAPNQEAGARDAQRVVSCGSMRPWTVCQPFPRSHVRGRGSGHGPYSGYVTTGAVKPANRHAEEKRSTKAWPMNV